MRYDWFKQFSIKQFESALRFSQISIRIEISFGNLTMKFIGKSYSLYTKDIHQIWCRSARFLWKSKFCSGSRSGTGSWFYFGFEYQTYISYIGDTHQICLDLLTPLKVIVSTWKVHVLIARQPNRQTDRQAEIFFACFVFQVIQIVNIRQKEKIFFFHSCDYNTFSFYILRLWGESKKIIHWAINVQLQK